MNPITNIDDPRIVKGLAHPLRVRILAMLHEREMSPVQLTAHIDAPLGTVAYHVRKLHDLGLVECVRTRKRRGATEHIYRAAERPRISDEAWESAGPVVKQVLIGATLQQIHEQASLSAARGGFDHRDAHVTRTVLALDAEGWRELAAAQARLLQEMGRIEEAAEARLTAGEGRDATRAGVVVMSFEATLLSDGALDGDQTPSES